MTPTPNVIEAFLTNLFVSSFVVDSVETLADDGDVQRYKLTSCLPTYGYIGGLVNGTMAIIAKGDNWITVRSGVELTPGTYTMNKPSFWHGTQKAIKNEISLSKSNLTYPLIYLQELENDGFVSDRLSNIGLDANCRFWFLIPCDTQNMTTKDRYDLYIKPMLNLAESFTRQIENSRYVCNISQDGNVIYHTNIGSSSEFGYLKDLLPVTMSGVELRVQLPIKKQYCNC